MANRVNSDFLFPLRLTSLPLTVHKESVDVALLTPWIHVKDLGIDVVHDNDWLFLELLVTMTPLFSRFVIISDSTSLVECDVTLQSNTDISPFVGFTSRVASTKPVSERCSTRG